MHSFKHPVSSSATLRAMFWERAFPWTWNSTTWLNYLRSDLQGSICRCLPTSLEVSTGTCYPLTGDQNPGPWTCETSTLPAEPSSPAPRDLELLISCHHLPSAGLRSVGHQAWLILVNILCVRQWAEIVWLLSNLNVWFFFGQVSLNKIFVWMLNRHENRHACFCLT